MAIKQLEGAGVCFRQMQSPPYGLFQVELMPLILLLRKHLPGRSQAVYLAKGQTGSFASQLLTQFTDLLLLLQAGKSPTWDELLRPFIALLESSEVGGILVEAIMSSLLRILQHQSALPQPHLLSKLLLTVTQCRFEASDYDRDELALSRLIDMIRWLVCEHADLVPLFDDEALGRCLFTLFALLKQPRFSRVLRGHAEMITLEVARALLTARECDDNEDPECLPLRPAKPVLNIPYPAGRSQETVVAAAELLAAQEDEDLEEMPKYRLSSHSQTAIVKYLLALVDPLDQRTDEQSAAVALHCLRHAGHEVPLLGSLMTALSTEGGKMSLPVGYCLDTLGSLRQYDQALTRILVLVEKCEGFTLQPKLRTQLEMFLPLLAALFRNRSVDLWLKVECSLEYQTMNLSKLSSLLVKLDSSPSQVSMLIRAMLQGILEEMTQSMHHPVTSRTSLEGRRLKGRLVEAAVLFGESPKQALSLLHQQGLLQDPAEHGQVASLLHRMHGLLDRRALGEFLAKPGSETLLHSFLSRFNLRGLRLDQALRSCMHAFRLPGEAQQISRVMEQLASVYFEQQEDNGFIKDADSAYILAYSIIMLNTDQHNKQVYFDFFHF